MDSYSGNVIANLHISRKGCVKICNKFHDFTEKNTEFTSYVTGKTYSLHHDVNCKTKQVIYLITCKRCNSQYVGLTKQPVSKRMNSHRFDINNFTDPAFSSMVAGHFNLQNHCLKDFSFMPIDVVKNDIDRLCKET